MKKFTNLKSKEVEENKKEKVLYDNDYTKLIEYEDWSIIKEKDCIVCIPYLIEQNKFIIRQEYIPTFKYRDGLEHHLFCVCGSIETGETPELALFRELEEEAGIVLRDNFHVEFEKPLFISKSSTNKYYPCILELNENDYHEVVIKGDGTRAESLSQTAKIDVKYLKSLNASDVLTEYMINKFKNYLNL